jgi:hypothetical protein
MRNPTALFWVFVSLHGIVWTLVPTVSQPNGPLDVIELLDWGRHPQWGYWKHPPLSAWIAEPFVQIAGKRLWGAYLASQIAICACLWAVWRFARSLIEPRYALLSVLMLEGILYYSYMSPQFNAGVLQVPLWAFTVLFLWRALNYGRIHDWLLCGVTAGLGLLTRYDMVFLLVSLLAFMLLNAQARKHFAKPGPYVALAVATFTFAPHVIWLSGNDFTTIHYALARATSGSSKGPFLDHLVHPLIFAFGQALVLAPVFIMMGMPASRALLRKAEVAHRGFAREFLFTATLGPFLAYLVISAIAGFSLTTRWGMPLWSFVGVFILYHLRPALTDAALRRFRYVFLGFAAFWVITFVGEHTFFPALTGRVTSGLFPGHAIADHVTAQWVKRYGTPLPIVGGDSWLAENVSFYSPDRPDVYLDLDPKRSPWTNDEQFKQRGGVIIWNAHTDGTALPYRWRTRFPGTSVQPWASFAWQTSAAVPPLQIAWALVPPASLWSSLKLVGSNPIAAISSDIILPREAPEMSTMCER